MIAAVPVRWPDVAAARSKMIAAVAIKDLNTGEVFRKRIGAVIHAAAADPDFTRRLLVFGYADDQGNFVPPCDVEGEPPRIRLDA